MASNFNILLLVTLIFGYASVARSIPLEDDEFSDDHNPKQSHVGMEKLWPIFPFSSSVTAFFHGPSPPPPPQPPPPQPPSPAVIFINPPPPAPAAPSFLVSRPSSGLSSTGLSVGPGAGQAGGSVLVSPGGSVTVSGGGPVTVTGGGTGR